MLWNRFLAVILIFNLSSFAATLGAQEMTPLDYTRVEPGNREKIEAHGLCRQVKNNNDDPVMVPHRSVDEWHTAAGSFLFEEPFGMEITLCTNIEEILSSFYATPYVDLNDQRTSTMVMSNEAVVSEFTGELPFAVSGGPEAAASINDGEWVTTGNVVDGDVIRLRTESAPEFLKTVSTSIAIGEYEGEWNVRTHSLNATCGFSQFNSAAGDAWGAWPGDRVSMLWTGPSIGQTPLIENIGEFCNFTGPVPIEIVSYTGTLQIGSASDLGGNPLLRINDGALATSGMYSPGDKLELLYTHGDGHVNSVTQVLLNGSNPGSFGQSTVQQKPITVPYDSFDYGTASVGLSTSSTSNAYTMPDISSSSVTWYPDRFTVISDPWVWNPTLTASVSKTSANTSTAASARIVKNGTLQPVGNVTFQSGDRIAIRLTSPASGTGTSDYRMIMGNYQPIGRSGDFYSQTYGGTAGGSTNFPPSSGVNREVITSSSLTVSGLSYSSICPRASISNTGSFSSFNSKIFVNGVDRGRSLVSICNGDSVSLGTTIPNSFSGSGVFTLTLTGWTKTWTVSY